MRVLIACEFSGVVRDAFLAKGHNAMSCDLLPTESPGPHFQGDAFEAIASDAWDLLIAHPPCTYLSRAGARWWKHPGRKELADAAAAFVFALRDSKVPRICIENPIGQLNARWRYPDQVIEPWEFGHPYSKATCLWLKNLPPLMPTILSGSYQPYLRSNSGKGKASGQKWSAGVVHTAKDASVTFAGIAAAMADQWGSL